MSFISLQFAIFLAITFVIYYVPLLARFQVAILVVASFVFYGSDQWQLIPLLLFAMLLTCMAMLKAIKGSKIALVTGIAGNLALLAFFKYKFLVIHPGYEAHTGVAVVDFLLKLPLPIGISFFIFHNISLIVDYYKEAHKRPVPTFLEVVLYILFFPQLVSGPITRSISFLPQIKFKKLSEIPIKQTAKLLILGYFFKLFVANNLAQVTAKMSPDLMGLLGGGDKVLLMFMYSAQIYADFFGYSTIALGLALLFGYRLPVNFNVPYVAASFSDFWTRWHISLSRWLRTYLYIPLGGNRVGPVRTYMNLLIVMGLGGLWHGAAISYLLWGLLHGLFLVLERGASDLLTKFRILPFLKNKTMTLAYSCFVFISISFAWIFFRFEHFPDASRYLQEILKAPLHFTQFSEFYTLSYIYASPVILQHFLSRQVDLKNWPAVEMLVYGVLLWLAIVERGAETQFIYFRF
jgi:D-alanyl-lipoteichoic acid acyltransferase DltB (MBOAT superfamily)